MLDNEIVIETNKLTKYYGKTRGIEDIDFSVYKGEIFGFLGPNGAGKTTTIRLLIGLLYPTRGSAKIFGKDVVRDSVSIRQEIGYIPGDVHLYPKMIGKELLNYFAAFRPDKPPVLMNDLVERFNLDTSKRVREYSKGNKQKLAIVLALMHEPELLILDEPTLGLDPLMQREFYQVLKEFEKKGKTIFLSSHILLEVERVCGRVGIVRNGHLVALENVDEIGKKKVRNMEVTFDEDVDLSALKLEGVTILDKQNHTFKMTIKGEVDPIIKKIAAYKVKDLVFTHAGLEEIFMEFYGKEANVD